MEKRKIFYGWWILVACTLITCFVVPPVVGMASRFVVPVTNDLGISRSAFAFSNTIVQALGIFLSPIVAKKIAKGNLKMIQTGAIFGFALALASYSFAQNSISLYISSFFIGIFYVLGTFLPISIVITNWFETHRGLAMSIAMAGIGLGGFLYSPIITFLLTNLGWRQTYQVIALVIACIVLPAVFFLIKKSPSEMGLRPLGELQKVSVESSEAKDEATTIPSLKSFYRQPFFILFLLGMFLNGIINNGAAGQFAPALEDKFGLAIVTTVVALYSLIGVFGKLLLGWLNDKFGLVVSLVVGCVAFGLSFVFMFVGDSAVFAYLMALSFGIGLGIGTVLPPLVTSAIFGKKLYAEAYGIGNSLMQFGMALGSLLIAMIFDKTGSYLSGWLLLLLFTALTLFCWLVAYARSKSSKKIQLATEIVSTDSN